MHLPSDRVQKPLLIIVWIRNRDHARSHDRGTHTLRKTKENGMVGWLFCEPEVVVGFGNGLYCFWKVREEQREGG